MSDIVERLRGIYRVPITDGLGTVDGNLEPDNENEFVRQFPSPPIQIEAADEITRLREDLANSLSYRDDLVSANEGLGVALSEAEQREKDARREGWYFVEGDLVRKKSGSWWEGRVVGTYSTAQTPRGYAVQLDKPNGPVQIYPESALVDLQSEER